ncbi:MAG: hypothetical protein WCD70_16335, partial [Alphaproteobacteria bacterium]
MNKAAQQRIATVHLPKLAAAIVFFLGLSTNTQMDTAPARSMQAALPHVAPQTPPAPELASDTSDPIRTLSGRDATLYRAAFAAQEKSDWATADDALAQIKDKRLVGHVLADRYLRREMSLTEAQQWMASYADLPEADTLYDQSRRLHGFATAHIARPVTIASWTGNNGANTLSGFRMKTPDSDDDASLRKNHIDSKINTALRHGDPMKAREILTTEIQRGTVSVKGAGAIMSHIAATFFYEGETERARPMAHMAATSGAPLGLWIDGLSAWKQQDFDSSARSFASLAQAPGLSPWDRAAASYWAYRAAKRTGDDVQAHHWLIEAAKYPSSFYGYMAASLAEHTPVRSWKMPDLNAKNIDILSQRPAGWRALALAQVGKTDLAESELRRLNPTGSRSLQ